jgi:hypothetical protein
MIRAGHSATICHDLSILPEISSCFKVLRASLGISSDIERLRRIFSVEVITATSTQSVLPHRALRRHEAFNAH